MDELSNSLSFLLNLPLPRFSWGTTDKISPSSLCRAPAWVCTVSRLMENHTRAAIMAPPANTAASKMVA